MFCVVESLRSFSYVSREIKGDSVRRVFAYQILFALLMPFLELYFCCCCHKAIVRLPSLRNFLQRTFTKITLGVVLALLYKRPVSIDRRGYDNFELNWFHGLSKSLAIPFSQVSADSFCVSIQECSRSLYALHWIGRPVWTKKITSDWFLISALLYNCTSPGLSLELRIPHCWI